MAGGLGQDAVSGWAAVLLAVRTELALRLGAAAASTPGGAAGDSPDRRSSPR